MMLVDVTAAVLTVLLVSATLYSAVTSSVESLKSEDAFVTKQYKAFQASEALVRSMLGEAHHKLDLKKLDGLCADWNNTKRVLRLAEYNTSLTVSTARCGDTVTAGVAVSRIVLCGGEPCVVTLTIE